MNKRDVEFTRRNILSLIFAFLVFVLFSYFVGFESLFISLQQVQITYYIVSAVVLLCVPIFKSIVWYRLFQNGRISISFWQIVLVYFASRGIKSLLPVGTVAVQPLIAYSISRENYFNTERVFAIISVGDILNIVPYFSLGLLGLLLFVLDGVHNLLIYIVSLVGGGVFLLSIGIVFWKYELLFLLILQKISVPIRWIGYKFSASWVDLVSLESIEENFLSFYSSLEMLFKSRLELVLLLALAHIATSVAVFGLMLVGVSMAVEIGFFTGCIMIAVSRFGESLPSPGGVGGVEAVMLGVGLLLTPYEIGELTVVVLLFRLITYWLTMFFGLSLSSKLTQEYPDN